MTLVVGQWTKIGFIAICYLALRLQLARKRPLRWLEERPEINVPMSSLKEHLEVAFLMRHQAQSIYEKGAECKAMPLMALLMDLLHQWNLLEIFFILIEFASAWAMGKIFEMGEKGLDDKGKREQPLAIPLLDFPTVFLMVLYNPFSLLTSIALNVSAITRASILLAIWCVKRQRIALTAFFLALGTYISVYPLLLCIPISLLLSDGRKLLFLFTAFWLMLIWRSSRELMGDYSFVRSYICHFSAPIGWPNLGISWYLFLEIFDYLRPLFLFILPCLMMVQIPAVCIRIGDRIPEVALYLAFAIIAVHRAYPNTADYSLLLDGLFLLPPSMISLLNRKLAAIISLLIPFLASQAYLQWYFWMHLGVGNANFYFAIGIAVNSLIVAWSLHIIWCAIQAIVRIDNPEIFAKAPEGSRLVTDQ